MSSARSTKSIRVPSIKEGKTLKTPVNGMPWVVAKAYPLVPSRDALMSMTRKCLWLKVS